MMMKGWQKNEAGVLVPIVQIREVWTSDEGKYLRRLQRIMSGKDLDVILKCRKCKEVVAFQDRPDGGGIEFVCQCKRRVFI